jgi:hypothetical protein
VPKLSVTVITKNEARDIGDALTSVAWADEIIVVDSFSTDNTFAIARQHTDHVVQRAWPGYVDQKNCAASLASHDWILASRSARDAAARRGDRAGWRRAAKPAPHPRVTCTSVDGTDD